MSSRGSGPCDAVFPPQGDALWLPQAKEVEVGDRPSPAGRTEAKTGAQRERFRHFSNQTLFRDGGT